jgi:hypothetical protein
MEEELKKLDVAIEKVTDSNLDNETKEFVLNVLKKRLFELRNELATVNRNVEIYQAGKEK